MTQLSPWLEGIAGEELPKIIESDAPLIRVIAGPGSGKTLAIERRIRRLIEGTKVPPARIFVGAFNREIARQLAESIASTDSDVEVSTIHSLAYRLLRENPVARQGRSLRILLGYELEPLLYDVGQMLDDGLTRSVRASRLRDLEASFARRLNLEETAFQGEVDRWLRDHDGMLIDEFVPFAARGLENGDIAPNLFDQVIIDEYQDLTSCEQFLIELIWSRCGSLAVFGDDDQSIYSFRHNHPAGITGFGEHWDDMEVEDHTLPANRRSGADIVDVANRLIAASGASKPPMESQYPKEATLAYVHWPTLEDEISGLAEYLQREGAGEYLVLVPLRVIGYRLRESIGDEAATSFHEEVLDSDLARERFALGSVLANHSDRVALRSWLGLQKSRPGHAQQWNAIAYSSIREAACSAAFVDSIEFCKKIGGGDLQVSGRGRSDVVARANTLVLAADSAPACLEELVDWLFDPTLSDEVEDGEERTRARRNLEELQLAAHQAASTPGVEGIEDVIGSLRYRIATRIPLDERTPPRVRIATLHSAKGLQADHVIVAGLADQIIPGPVGDSSEREERRRLLYVAVTRPREELVLSRPRRMKYSDAQHNRVRIDQVRYQSGERWVILGASSFIPLDFPQHAQPGTTWLQSHREAGDC